MLCEGEDLYVVLPSLIALPCSHHKRQPPISSRQRQARVRVRDTDHYFIPPAPQSKEGRADRIALWRIAFGARKRSFGDPKFDGSRCSHSHMQHSVLANSVDGNAAGREDSEVYPLCRFARSWNFLARSNWREMQRK